MNPINPHTQNNDLQNEFPHYVHNLIMNLKGPAVKVIRNGHFYPWNAVAVLGVWFDGKRKRKWVNITDSCASQNKKYARGMSGILLT